MTGESQRTEGALAGLPDGEWWTEAEIAAARLRGMPSTQRGMHDVVARLGWRRDPQRARRRAGRGGGWVYHESLFPAAALDDIAVRRMTAGEAADGADDDAVRKAAWRAWAEASEAQRAEAGRRAGALRQVEALIRQGATVTQAARGVSAISGFSAASIFRWRQRTGGASAVDWPALLIDRRAEAEGARAFAEIDDHVFDLFLADYLRPERASMRSCWERAGRIAAKEGLVWPRYETVRRRFKREVSPATETLARDGVEAFKKTIPAQRRDKSGLHAMEAVVGDGHRWDVAVRWDDGEIARPNMVAFQDVHSGRIVSWRIARTEHRGAVLAAFGAMVETFGIPYRIVLDNGRAFASKWLTGQLKHRYRWRLREDDPLGVFPQLDIQVTWATPYSGRSKPIERAFRDFCDHIAKHPAFAGAYVGNAPDAKPENYGARAVPIAEFEAVVAREIAEHNRRPGRRSPVCAGRSFLEVFEESYARSPIRKATAEQRLFWLLGAEGVRADRDSGAVKLFDNLYWCQSVSQLIAGQKIIARFDPAALHDGIHVFDMAGKPIGHMPAHEKTGFFDFDGAKRTAQLTKRALKAERAALDALNLVKADELARRLREIDSPDAPPPSPSVVRPIFAGNPYGAASRAFAAAWDADLDLAGVDIAEAQALQEMAWRVIPGGLSAPPGGSPP